MAVSVSDQFEAGEYWGAGRFMHEDAVQLHGRLGRAVAAKLIGVLQLISESGDESAKRTANEFMLTLRQLSAVEREWLLTHPVTSDAIRELTRQLAVSSARGEACACNPWMCSNLGNVIRGARLVAGHDVEWEAEGSFVLPGIGLRIESDVRQWIQIRHHGDRMTLKRQSAGTIEIPVVEAKPGQWMAIESELALPSFQIGNYRVHIDAEDPAFKDRWVSEARFGDITATASPRSELGRWILALEAASRVAESTVPLSAGLFGVIVRTVVPIVSPNLDMGCSLSDRDLPGAIMTTIDGPAVLAENLLHEFRHNLLHQLEQAYPLYQADSPAEARYYSPWRDDPRPLHGILHALFVFLDVCAVHAGVRASSMLDERSNYNSAVSLASNVMRIEIALDEFKRHARMTEFGSGFVKGIEDSVAAFQIQLDQLPSSAVEEARHAVIAHREARGLRA